MSRAFVRDLSGFKAGQEVDKLIDALPGVISSAASQYVDLLRRSVRLIGEAVPSGLGLLSSSNDCCGVPTQACPPRCVAEICWEACLGEAQHAVINVENTGRQSRNFTFAAGALGPAKPTVSPASAELAPGQIVAVQVSVPAGQGFRPGETYRGELTIRGAYEQCVKLVLRLATPQPAEVDVRQGEAPQRITELKWYRHFQCAEPCDRGEADMAQATPPAATVGHPN
jgi:hypothetical protein